jgi:hypothetical protein
MNCRYTPENRRLILDSRIHSTRVLGEALASVPRPPRVWLQSSTATIYTHRHDAPNDEASESSGSGPMHRKPGSSARACARPGSEPRSKPGSPNVRQVLLRTAFTMSPDSGGVFDVMLWLVRRGLGGTLGSGRQYVSWIHDQDFVASALWLIDCKDIEGPVNLASPEPLPNAEFMRILRETWGTRPSLPVTRVHWMLELGAVCLKTETELVLKSRRVIPTRLLESGYRLRFPGWKSAAADLCSRWRSARGC